MATHSAEYMLERRVNVERLKSEILLSQPAPPPQCDSSPRLSPVVDTGSDETGTPHAESQSTKGEVIFPLQASRDSFLHVNTSLDQEGTIILLQPDVGVDDEEKTITSEQVAACEEFTRPSKKRRQQRITAWTTERSKQFDPGG